MELLYGYGLTVLEMVFILAFLLILHNLRKLLGQAALYFAMGMLLVFTQITGASGLLFNTGIAAMDFHISSAVLVIPFLAMLVVIYVEDGTLEAQRLIIGLLLAFGFYLYLSSVTLVQCSWPGYVISQGPANDVFAYILRTSRRFLAATALAALADLFILPIFYQRLLNLKCGLFFCVAGSLLAVQVVDHIVFATVAFWGTPDWWRTIGSSYVTRGLFAVLVSIPTSIYLKRSVQENPGESRRTVDIILAFFGAYGRSLRLEQSLQESEERYRLLVANASDMIVIMDQSWRILEANHAACRALGAGEKKGALLLKRSFLEVAGLSPGEAGGLGMEVSAETLPFHASVKIPGTDRELEVSINVISYNESLLVMLTGRDVTERRKLEQEKEDWERKMSHVQRLEAVGRLAGGIAHDFNNYLHAIQGHLDIIRYMHEVNDKDVERNLEKIDNITQLAAKLTSQMLSFARKGNYQPVKLELRELVEHCSHLFLPGSAGITFLLKDDGEKHFVTGDSIQLQQVLMNLLINAKDAMKDTPDAGKIIEAYVGSPEKAGIKLDPPPDVKRDEGKTYTVIRILDHGTGIDEKVRSRIFEPFFTTKSVGEGTGMGLAMAYGTLITHNGWIQCCNVPGAGAAFDMVLPRVRENS
ncbi:MAG: PAS domain S-box protein [Lentisphaeria bacterium]|nr:PAS domain S-box protein [Lentisphaeria bacterium]